RAECRLRARKFVTELSPWRRQSPDSTLGRPSGLEQSSTPLFQWPSEEPSIKNYAHRARKPKPYEKSNRPARSAESLALLPVWFFHTHSMDWAGHPLRKVFASSHRIHSQ